MKACKNQLTDIFDLMAESQQEPSFQQAATLLFLFSGCVLRSLTLSPVFLSTRQLTIAQSTNSVVCKRTKYDNNEKLNN